MSGAPAWQRSLLCSTLVGMLCLASCGVPSRAAGAERARQVAEQAAWSDNVSISFGADKLIVRSDGLPHHELLRAYQAVSVFDHQTTYLVEPKALRVLVAVPLQPRMAAAKTPSHIGLIGIAVSGALIYSPYEADGRRLAMEISVGRDGPPFIDACNGHPNPFAVQYHYHSVPHCLTRLIDRPGEHSRLLGYLLDGFPVYGPQDAGGVEITPAQLDACNGHDGPTPEHPAGIYHYHITAQAPYTMACYSGEISLGTSDLAVLARGVDLGAYWLPLLSLGVLVLASVAMATRLAWRTRLLSRRPGVQRALLLLGVAALVTALDLAAMLGVFYAMLPPT